jgi:hypothetical protein
LVVIVAGWRRAAAAAATEFLGAEKEGEADGGGGT